MSHIELTEALERLGNSEKLYCKLLNGFINKYEFVSKDFQEIIKRGDMEEARRLAHSLKGLCANLGANKLSDLAKTLEYAFRDETGNYEPLIEQYNEELKEVLIELRSLNVNRNIVDCNNQSETLKIVDEETYKELIKDLFKALNSFKYSEIKVTYNQLKTYKIPELYKELMPTIFEAIDHFDYKVAASLIESQL